MRVAVIGAGIVGVTTAYELASDGHEVVVFERRASVAEEASFANAGVVSPGCIARSAPFGTGAEPLERRFAPRLPMRLGGLPDAALLRWLSLWRRARRAPVDDGVALYRLAAYSRQRLQALTGALKLEHEQADGVLLMLRGSADVARARRGLRRMAEWGVDFHLVDAARCRQIEPGLDADAPLHAGVHLAHDGVGNCRQFAHLLRGHAQRLGVRFCFQQEVVGLQPGRSASTPLAVQHVDRSDGGAETDRAAVGTEFEAAVVCSALGALPLLASLGLRLPMAAAYGCSVTAPLRTVEGHPDFGPRSALIDARHGVTITRLGQRVRIAGGTELGGPAERIAAAPLALLYKVLHEWFPGAARLEQAQHWKGAQPTMPDGRPVLGASGRPGVWLNLGHGAEGWALACGSARVLADAVAGRPPEVDVSRLGWRSF